jgi:hypothetical protein
MRRTRRAKGLSMLTSNQRETLVSWVESLTKIRRQRPSPGADDMGPEEWKRDADSVLASAHVEDIRNALLGRLAERYAKAGAYTLTLTIKNQAGQTATTTAVATVQ